MVPFRTLRGPLIPKPVTGQELFLNRFLQQTGSNIVVEAWRAEGALAHPEFGVPEKRTEREIWINLRMT